MNISTKKFDTICVMYLPHNILNTENAEHLKIAVNEAAEEGYTTVLLNMATISKIDDKGLASLLKIQKIALYNHINLSLFELHPNVSQMIYLTRLNRIFDICKPEDQDLYMNLVSNDFRVA